MGMSQEAFVARYIEGWLELEALLERAEGGDVERPLDDLPKRYRQVCRHLAMAQSRGYSPSVRERLERLVERGHALIYRHRRDPWGEVWGYIGGGFARDVRANWPVVLAASFLFWGPFLGLLLWFSVDPEVAIDLFGVEHLARYEEMYSGEGGGWRDERHDIYMFGHYIFNNVGISLRSFGSGLFFGVGSLLTLLWNGVALGGVAGYLTGAGYGAQLWPFVAGHSALELTATVLSGAAGLKIGMAPVWPGRRSRLEALLVAARESVGLILGFSVMLILAAFIEAFWSPREVDAALRLLVGGVLWGAVILYFALAGRGRRGSG